MNQKQIEKIRLKRVSRIESLLTQIDRLQESGHAAKFQIQKLEKELRDLDVDLSCNAIETELRCVSFDSEPSNEKEIDMYNQNEIEKSFDERIDNLVYTAEFTIATLRDMMLATHDHDKIQQIRNIFEKLNEQIDNCIIDSMVPLVLSDSAESEFESTPLEDFVF